MQRDLLSGEFEHALDEKGRVTLPARYRDYFNAGAFLARFVERDPCIRVYHPDSWREFDSKYLEPLDEFDSDEDSWRIREIYRNLSEVVPDKQGRVLLPSAFIEELGLSGKVRIIGSRTHLEIWDPATLQNRATERRSRNAS